MTRRAETIDIAAERQRIAEELDDVADRVADLENDVDGDDPDPVAQQEYQETLQRGHRLEAALAGLAWAQDPDTDGIDTIDELTVSALTAGDHARVADRTEALADQKASEWGLTPEMDAANQIEFAAAGLEDAPFLDGDEGHTDKVAILSDCSPQFVRWLAGRVDDVSTPDIEGNGFGARVAAARATDEPDSPGPEQS